MNPLEGQPPVVSSSEHPSLERRTSLGLAHMFGLKRSPSDIRKMDSSPVPFLATEESQAAFEQRLQEKNEREQAAVRHIFEEQLREQGVDLNARGIAIATCGSDGREEKTGSFSPVELMVIAPAHFPPDLESIVEKIKEIVQAPTPLRGMISPQNIDVKDLGGKRGLVNTIVLPRATKVIPTRPIDATLLTGSQSTFQRYKQKAVEEWKEGRVRIGDFQRDFVRAELKNLEAQLEGIGPGVSFHSETGELIFIPQPSNPREFSQRGPKYGATRFLQYSLTKFLIHHLGKVSAEEGCQFLNDLPKSTVARVRWLARGGILPLTEEEVRDFRTVYDNLILWYAILQDRASRTPVSPVTAMVPTETLKMTLDKAKALGSKILEACK